MRSRLLLPAVVLALTVAVTGCGSSADKKAPAQTPASLSSAMQKSLAQASSAHLEVDAGALGSYVVDAMFHDGKASATDVTATQGGQTTLIRTVNGTSWAKLPTAAGSKPWIALAGNSTRPEVAALSTTLAVVGAASSLDALSQLVATASDFTDKGEQSIGGTHTTEYSLKLDPAKGPADSQLTTLLKQVGQKAVPVTLWVDDQQRPVKFTITSLVSVSATITKYNAPLSITAPSADQISTP